MLQQCFGIYCVCVCAHISRYWIAYNFVCCLRACSHQWYKLCSLQQYSTEAKCNITKDVLSVHNIKRHLVTTVCDVSV